MLIALHESFQRDMLGSYAEGNGYTVIKPSKSRYEREEFAKLLDEHKPVKVFMDVNYGSPGSPNFDPLSDTSKLMIQRNYDIKQTLLGVTGHMDLAELIESEHQLPATGKLTRERIFDFLS